jgi:hypothetical protein
MNIPSKQRIDIDAVNTRYNEVGLDITIRTMAATGRKEHDRKTQRNIPGWPGALYGWALIEPMKFLA